MKLDVVFMEPQKQITRKPQKRIILGEGVMDSFGNSTQFFNPSEIKHHRRQSRDVLVRFFLW